MHLFCLLCVLFVSTSALKILGYNSIYAHSHSNYIGKIADVLSEAGHEVVLLTPVINSRISNRTSVHARVIFFNQTAYSKAYEEIFDRDFSGQWMTKTTNVFGMFTPLENALVAFTNQCKEIIESPGLLDILREENFDVGYTEEMDQCGYGKNTPPFIFPAIFYLLDITKYATAHSLPTIDGAFAFTGMPSIPSYVPGMACANNEKMSLWERINNLAGYAYLNYYYRSYWSGFDRTFREMHLNIPSHLDLLTASSFFFVNTEPLLDFPRPSVAKIIEIGGITASKFHPLNDHWSSILSRRNKNVFISFGSMTKSSEMPDEYKKSIRTVIRSFPDVTFIWKYETPDDGIADDTDNLVAVKWVPQIDLLNDPRLSLFVTHGGAGSITEATFAGVPLVVIPIFADQFRNGLQANRTEASIFVKKEDLATPHALHSALRSILEEPRYQNRAKWIAEMLADRPFSMKDRLVRHFEFMAKYGPFPQLDHYGTKLSFIEYYLLDVAAIAALVVLSGIAFSALFLRFLFANCKVRLLKSKAE